MHTLTYFYNPADGLSDEDRVQVVRTAIAAAGGIDSTTFAMAVIRRAMRRGHCKIATSASHDKIMEGWQVLIDNKLTGMVDATPEDIFSVAGGHTPPTPEPATPAEPETTEIGYKGYATALALLAAAEGNPLIAANQARVLAGTTGEVETFTNAIEALSAVFPWLLPMLKDEGIIL